MTIKQQGGIFGRNPSFNDLEAEQATVNGLVNIQSNRPQIFLYEQDRTDNNVRIECSFDNLNISQVDDSNGSPVERLTVEMDTGDVYVNDGNLVIGTSGQGIDFSATSGTGTSELFDDYEEGTWTPVVQDTSGNSASTSSAAGAYTKVGDLVTAFMRIVDVNKTGLTAGDAIRVYGLPYTGAGNTRYGGSAIINTWTGTTGLITQVIGGNAFVQFKTSSNGNALVSEITSGSADIYAQVTYKV